MPKISHQCRCNYNDESAENRFFGFQAKGDTIAFTSAFPTKDSRGAAACEKAVTVSTNSFIRRPALIDEAISAISGFMNEAIYALQEPQKSFLCSTATLFIHKGNFRCVLTGSSHLLHFCNGKLITDHSSANNPILGSSLKSKFTAEAASKLPNGNNAFLFYNGYNEFSYDITELEAALKSSDNAEEWLNQLWKDSKTCSLCALIIPEKKAFLADLFTKK